MRTSGRKRERVRRTRQCPRCTHRVSQHSQEPAIGCLHRLPHTTDLCLCLQPGTSKADQ